MKERLKEWNREVFGGLSKRKNELTQRTEELDIIEARDGLDGNLRNERIELKLSLKKYFLRNKSFGLKRPNYDGSRRILLEIKL